MLGGLHHIPARQRRERQPVPLSAGFAISCVLKRRSTGWDTDAGFGALRVLMAGGSSLEPRPSQAGSPKSRPATPCHFRVLGCPLPPRGVGVTVSLCVCVVQRLFVLFVDGDMAPPILVRWGARRPPAVAVSFDMVPLPPEGVEGGVCVTSASLSARGFGPGGGLARRLRC